MALMQPPATSTRVEGHTSPDVNARIRARSDAEVVWYEGADREVITTRIEELEREWDIEQALQANSSVLALTGVVLGHTVDRRWFAVPAVIYSFLLVHAVQGWCPPLPVLRRLGLRTRREIDRERFALKVMRGDFVGIPTSEESGLRERVRQVLAAVDA